MPGDSRRHGWEARGTPQQHAARAGIWCSKEWAARKQEPGVQARTTAHTAATWADRQLWQDGSAERCGRVIMRSRPLFVRVVLIIVRWKLIRITVIIHHLLHLVLRLLLPLGMWCPPFLC